MARVEIRLPETFLFSTEIPIRITDLNYGNHLGNDSVLGLLHEARVQFLRSLGFTELDVAGVGIILADAAIIFRAEGHYGMCLRVQIGVAEFSSKGCDVLYRVTDALTGKDIAHAKTGMLFFDYTERRVVRIPDAFRQALERATAN